MYCSGCGTQLVDTAAFCPECGQPKGSGPRASAPSQIESHLRVLGILWLTLSALRIIPGLILVALFWVGNAFVPQMPGFPEFFLIFFPLIGGLILAFAVAGIVAGWGLLARAAWARTFAIVFAFLNLLDIPFGTALGVYTLGVLLPAESERAYRLAVDAA